jgi:type II secretory ATPase GspE/PulE/Tfp pilus assembly ATPase PilB-like protein
MHGAVPAPMSFKTPCRRKVRKSETLTPFTKAIRLRINNLPLSYGRDLCMTVLNAFAAALSNRAVGYPSRERARARVGKQT